MVETTLDALAEVRADIREKLDHAEATTPRTFQHYTQALAGSSFGTKFEGLAVSRGLPEQINGTLSRRQRRHHHVGWLGAMNYGVIVANDVDALLMKTESPQPESVVACMSLEQIHAAIPHRRRFCWWTKSSRKTTTALCAARRFSRRVLLRGSLPALSDHAGRAALRSVHAGRAILLSRHVPTGRDGRAGRYANERRAIQAHRQAGRND